MGSTRKSNIALNLPYSSALVIFCRRSCLCVFSKSCSLYFLNFFKKFYINAVLIVNPTCRIGNGNNICTEHFCLFYRINSNITGTRYTNSLALNIGIITFEHFFCKVEKSVACCLGSCKRAAVRQAFTGKYALVSAAYSLILTEHIADFSCACTDIACRNVCIGADYLTKFCHKTLAEHHNFSVALSLRVKVRSALTAADRKTCQ